MSSLRSHALGVLDRCAKPAEVERRRHLGLCGCLLLDLEKLAQTALLRSTFQPVHGTYTCRCTYVGADWIIPRRSQALADKIIGCAHGCRGWGLDAVSLVQHIILWNRGFRLSRSSSARYEKSPEAVIVMQSNWCRVDKLSNLRFRESPSSVRPLPRVQWPRCTRYTL